MSHRAFFFILLTAISFAQPPIPHRTTDGNAFVYMNFVVNSHDFTEPQTACTTLMRAAHIFNKYSIKADFYFVEQLVTTIHQRYPWFADSLISLGMEVNIHHRAPHIMGFKSAYIASLMKKPFDSLVPTMIDYETKQLDQVTGLVKSGIPGGYSFIKETFGRPPVVVSTGENGGYTTLGSVNAYVCKTLGARAVMLYHESGSDEEYPLFFSQGLLSRPVDYSITRWTAGSQTEEQFWWDMIDTPDEQQYDPARFLQSTLDTADRTRLTFVNAIIHETDFHYSLPPWRACYYADSMSTQARNAPFDTTRTAPYIRILDMEREEKIWKKYDSLVRYVSQQKTITTYTMKDLLSLVADDRERTMTKEQLKQIAAQIVATAPNQFPPKFFTIGSDFFSPADAFYGLNTALTQYAENGSFPSAVQGKDLLGTTDTATENISSASLVNWDELRTAVRRTDSLFVHYTSIDPRYGRIPSSIRISANRAANPLEYMYLIASEFLAIEKNGTTASIQPKEYLSYRSKQIYTQPVRWTEKPARRISSLPTTVQATRRTEPTGFTLGQNYPNPFNPSTTIRFTIPASQDGRYVTLRIFDILGREIVTPVNDARSAGTHSVSVSFPPGQSSGVYFYQLRSGEFSQTQRMIYSK